MKIASYDVHLLNLGNFLIDGGAMHGVIPKPIWEKGYPADENNRIKLFSKCPLLISDSKKILIDVGPGNKQPEKFIRNYELTNSYEILLQELAKHNIKPEEITDVILTHLHFDHCGGSTYFENGKVELTFPNAKYYIQKSQFEWAKNPSEKDRASFFQNDFMPLLDQGKLVFLDGDTELFPNISLYKVNGHTYGMQLVGIYDDNIKLLYCSDLLPLASHINIPYIMSYDLLPMITLEEKKLFLEECFSNDVMLLFEHDMFNDVVKLGKNEKGIVIEKSYRWEELS